MTESDIVGKSNSDNFIIIIITITFSSTLMEIELLREPFQSPQTNISLFK